MPRTEHALYVPYVSGAVWVVRHAHTVLARHASRREAIEDARRRAEAAAGPTSDKTIRVQVQADDGSWHLLNADDPAADTGDAT